MRLVDTNVLLYAVSAAAGETAKRERAIALLESGGLSLSAQVLGEFFHQATRPTRPNALTAARALAFLAALDAFPVQPVTHEVFLAAVTLSERYGLSYWDSAILAAARAMECDAVYSEDMSAQQDYDGIAVINPFADLGMHAHRGP